MLHGGTLKCKRHLTRIGHSELLTMEYFNYHHRHGNLARKKEFYKRKKKEIRDLSGHSPGKNHFDKKRASSNLIQKNLQKNITGHSKKSVS